MKARYIIPVILSLLICTSANTFAQDAPENPGKDLSGVWQVVEAYGNNSEGEWKVDTEEIQPGLQIFHNGYYSFMSVTGGKPRQLFSDPDNRTDAEMLAIYDPFVAIAGTYEVKDEKLFRKAMVAKNSNVMALEEMFESEYKIEGDQLIIIDRGEDWSRHLKFQRVSK